MDKKKRATNYILDGHAEQKNIIEKKRGAFEF